MFYFWNKILINNMLHNILVFPIILIGFAIRWIFSYIRVWITYNNFFVTKVSLNLQNQSHNRNGMGKFEFVLFFDAEGVIPQEKKLGVLWFSGRGMRHVFFMMELFPADKKSSGGREQVPWFGLEFGFRYC